MIRVAHDGGLGQNPGGATPRSACPEPVGRHLRFTLGQSYWNPLVREYPPMASSRTLPATNFRVRSLLGRFAALGVSLAVIGTGMPARVVGADATTAGAASSPVGRTIDDFELSDVGGKIHRLSDYASAPVVVVTFLGAECPLARLYGPRLAELSEQWAQQGVVFLGINSNQQDSLQELKSFVQISEIQFPLLKDVGNVVADQFGAVRVPEAFVLDRQRVVRYWGRIDDQYGYDAGVGYQRPEATDRSVHRAIEELLAGRPVSVPETKAPGCHIGRVRSPEAGSEITYSKHIAPILQARCVECHRPGEVGPFALLSYEEVVGWGEMIREVVDNGRMPPWGASPEHGSFLNDPRLSQEEKDQIVAWVEAGCPEGNPADLPPPRQFVEGWNIEEPDQVVYMSDEPYTVPAEGVVDYQYFEVDPGFQEDVWIEAAEARPGSRAVVHHIIVFIKPPGSPPGHEMLSIGPNSLLAGYAPGSVPSYSYPGMARLVKAGSKLLFQMHYTPNGKQAQDRSYLGLKFARAEDVEHDVRSGFAIQVNLNIPPHEDDYVATASRKFRHDTWLLGLMPHMHVRGKSFRYEVEYPDGRKEVLLDVPRYDFNWQLSYIFPEPKVLPKGTKLLCTAHYDNSANNLANPDPSIAVRWGDQTWEEMMIGWIITADPEPVNHRSPEPAQPGEAGR